MVFFKIKFARLLMLNKYKKDVAFYAKISIFFNQKRFSIAFLVNFFNEKF